MQKGEWILSFLIFSTLYLFTSSFSALPVYADENQTNMTNETHLECVNRSCVLVNNTLGNNTNLCAVSTDCYNLTNVTYVRANRTMILNLTHLACINQACVSVNGSGFDTCQTNAQCNLTNLTRTICIAQACVLVNISDINGTVIDCTTYLDCQNLTNSTGGGGGGNGSNGSSGGNDLPLAP